MTYEYDTRTIRGYGLQFRPNGEDVEGQEFHVEIELIAKNINKFVVSKAFRLLIRLGSPPTITVQH